MTEVSKLQNPSETVNHRLSTGWVRLQNLIKEDKKYGRVLSSSLLLLRGVGIVPKFDDLDSVTVNSMLDTAIETLRMVRDGDSESNDPRAREVYRKLFTDSPGD